MQLNNCGAFAVLPITMPAFSLNGKQVLPIHTLFMRPHSSRKDDLPTDKTIFIVNLPIDASEAHLQRLFRKCGVIQKIVWKKPTSGFSAHVVFEDAESVQRSMSMKARQRTWGGNDDAKVGLAKFISEFLNSRPSIAELKTKVDAEIEMFNEHELRDKLEAEEKLNLPDEDGFVTVTKGGRRKDGKGAVAGAAFTLKDGQTVKKPKEGLVDFYRFQMREAKRGALADLRQKFEQDKLKIAALKDKRRFKPY